MEFPHRTSHLKKYSNKTKSSYLDWYYSDIDSEKYPVRDVTKLGKFEPHLTIPDFETVEKNVKMVSEKYSKLEKKFDKLLTYFEENNIRVPEYIQQHRGLGLAKKEN